MLIGISPDYLYLHEKQPKNISELHRPYFLVFCPKQRNIETARNEIINKWKENRSTDEIFSKIEDIGEIQDYNSFWDFESKKKVFKVYTKKSYFVPELSDYLFFNHNLYTAEHDIPYQQRALVDLASSDKFWLFDTNSKKKSLKVLVYDIETSEYGQGNENIPIDIIGYSDFDIVFESSKNLENEEFSFETIDCPSDWENVDIKQLVSRNVNEEIDNLSNFCDTILKYDIISGHNIIGFDNFQIYNRINWILKSRQEQLSSSEKKIFQTIISKYSRPDKSFYFGIHSEAVQFYPCSFDTYLGVRKFYSFLDDYSLKSVAPFLGINLKDRIYLTPGQIKIDERTLKYNKQDVQEQIGVTLNLIQQALPLSFTTCMPFDMLLSSGAVSMWDHMSLIRGAMHKKIMPPICRVLSISQTLLRDFKGCNTKEDIIKTAKDKKQQLSKDFVRVIKYGDEMPDWMEYPYVIYNVNAKDADDELNYHMPGGMTIKPDKEAFSHFIPWFYVIVADVGAMYPTILKAMNVGADTVRLAKKNEEVDDWIWLKKIPKELLTNKDVKYREITKEDSFADEGIMLGVKIDKKPGVVNCAMTGIMHMIAKTKKELQKAKKTGNKLEIERLKMMYQSVKGARNAGSVDYSQRIIIAKPDGKIHNIKIGEFVDDAINKYGWHKEIINGTEFEIADIKENWNAFSVSINGKTQIKRIKQAIRHKWKNKLIKITTKSGYTVVTPNHSVFTLKNGKIVDLPASEINQNTLLVHARKIPQIEKKLKINLLKEVKSDGYYAFIDRENLNLLNGFKEKLISFNEKSNRSDSYLKIDFNKNRNLDVPDNFLKYISIGSNGKKASRIPAVINVDERLAELIGYYISEGYTSKKFVRGKPQFYITFSNASEKMHKRIKKLSKEILNLDVYTLNRIRDTGVIVSTLHPKILNYLFEDILECGVNSKNKKVPHQILSSSESVKNTFFKAYMDGDGNYKKEMPSSVPLGRYTTNSRYLNEDLITLQKQFGAMTNTYIRKNDGTYNTRMVGFFKGERQYLEDCYAIPPKNIEFVKPSSDYVYDISVEDNENFIDANGGILLHNTHGILAAPAVSGRQFNLWGATEITTKGQAILADTLNYLKKKNIRVVYGDSVDSETDIIIKGNNLIKITNIKDLFEKQSSHIYKKENHEYKKLKDIECLSVNNNGICEWKKANFIKRHPYKNDIIKVKTQRGMISVTKNHSLYTISKNIKEIYCKQLNCKDTNIVHISNFNEKGKKIIINALNPLVEFNNELNIVFNIPLKNSTKNLLKYYQHRKNYKGKVTLNKKYIRIKLIDAIHLYKRGIIKNKYLKNCFISSYNGKGKIPVIYKLGEGFAKILGAYAAEGSIYIRTRRKGTTKEGAHIFVCGHNLRNLKKLKSILIKIFNKNFTICSAGFDKNGENFRIQGNSSTAYIFKYVTDCGQGSSKKKVSPYILSSTKNIQKAFLDEYVRGDGYYETKYRIKPLLGIQTKSLKLVEGLSLLGLNIKLGYPSIRYRKEKSAYHLRFVQYNLNSIEYKSITGLIPQKIEFTKPHDGYVYDISVEKNNNFVCANGLIPAHNTDGIYLGCSNSIGNVPDFSNSLGLNISKDEKNWLTKPEDALFAIDECDKKWQKDLNYPDFELEPEIHDCMIFVKHKNYLIFDSKDGKIEMVTKGNNFKGSDKADIARIALNDIMMEVLKENHTWVDEEEARKAVKNSIINKTKEIVSKIDLTKVDINDLTLVQSVQPAKRYKPIQNGVSVFSKRASALENLLGHSIKSRIKLKFVVTKKPLPGITNPSKSGVKPIDYMYPIDFLKNRDEIDLEWYKKMIENYIQGAFGLSDISATEQTGLDSWM